jgi:hypothetical protein
MIQNACRLNEQIRWLQHNHAHFFLRKTLQHGHDLIDKFIFNR